MVSIPIPTSVARLFWDLDSGTLDMTAHKGTIIERVLNYGTLSDWRWLVSAYGRPSVQNAFSQRSPRRGNGVRNESARLAALLIQ